MKKKAFTLFITTASFFMEFPANGESTLEAIEKPALHMGVGEQRYFQTAEILRYSIGNPIFHVMNPGGRLQGKGKSQSFQGQYPNAWKNTLMIKAVRAGQSDIWIWSKEGPAEHRKIYIEAYEKKKSMPEALLQSLGQLQTAEIIPTPEGTVIRGEIQSLSEAKQIEQVARSFPKWILNETILSQSLLDTIEVSLKKWLEEQKLSHRVWIEKYGNVIWLRGNVKKTPEKARIEAQVRVRFPGIESDLKALPDDSPTVHFQVYLLEVKKNRFHTLGLEWPSSQEGAFRVIPWKIQNQLDLDITLQAMAGNGSLRVLSNPQLVVRAPGNAELFAGGELPIRVRDRNTLNVSWKPHGLMLKLNVTHTAGDQVRLDILTELSHLHPDSGNDDIPGIQTNRMKTQVDATFGKPLFLCGLLQDLVRQKARGLPILREIPILGLLFGSEDYLNEKSELVAIITPHAEPPPVTEQMMNRVYPKGPVPISRNWISPQEEERLKRDPAYPWNALQ